MLKSLDSQPTTTGVNDRNTDYSFLLVAVFDVVNACENLVSLLSLLW